MYLDVDDSEGPYKLNIITLGEHFPRIFRIKVTQLDAEDALFSPKHCLQYFTEETGIIQSFNYRNEFFENPSEVTTGYFVSQKQHFFFVFQTYKLTVFRFSRIVVFSDLLLFILSPPPQIKTTYCLGILIRFLIF